MTLRHTTLGRTPLDEWSTRRINLYLTTTTLIRDNHPCPRRDSNLTIPASERPQNHAVVNYLCLSVMLLSFNGKFYTDALRQIMREREWKEWTKKEKKERKKESAQSQTAHRIYPQIWIISPSTYSLFLCINHGSDGITRVTITCKRCVYGE
jgi:hypothetical protein